MKIEISPTNTPRKDAFELWMTSPMPMVTITKTFDVTNLTKISKKSGYKINALLCWCIGKAASGIEEFYLLPEHGKLFQYDELAINIIVRDSQNGINSCDIPYSNDFEKFYEHYVCQTKKTAQECKSSYLEDHMIIGTSAVIHTELDSIINQYTDKFSNPMLMWGKIREHWFKNKLPISFQFHHVQMDGGHAAHFFERLQHEIRSFKVKC